MAHEMPTADRLDYLESQLVDVIENDQAKVNKLKEFIDDGNAHGFFLSAQVICLYLIKRYDLDVETGSAEFMWVKCELWVRLGGSEELVEIQRPKSYRYWVEANKAYATELLAKDELRTFPKHKGGPDFPLFDDKVDAFLYAGQITPTAAEIDAHIKAGSMKLAEVQKKFEAQLSQTLKASKGAVMSQIITKNVNVATTAAVLEAGRIANNQITKVISKKAPIMVRGYVDTPLGKLVMANLANMAAQHFRPDDTRLLKLTDAMMVQAYQEVIQDFDIEGMIESLLDNKNIKQALEKVDGKKAKE